MIPRLALCSALAAGLLLGSARGASAGEPDEAARLFKSALTLMEAGKPGAACPALEKSFTLDPRPGTLFTLAECEALRGRIARAYARYDEYLNMLATLPADKKAKQGDRPKEARAARDALSKRVPTLKVVLPDHPPAGLVVERDDTPMSSAIGGLAVPVEPGTHVIGARAPGMQPWRQSIEIAEGASVVVVVPALDAPRGATPVPAQPQEMPTPSEDKSPSAQRTAGIVVGVLGLAGVAAGAALGVVAKNKWNGILSRCADPDARRGCDPSDQPAIQSAGRLADGATASFLIGGAAVVTGIVLWVTAPKARSTSAWQIIPAPVRSGAACVLQGAF